MQLPKVELKQANIPMWIFQNTFASTETQRHVKPLRMIDEVCFEMANIKQTRLKMEEKQEKSLSDKDKNLIKQAVLRAVENGCLEPALIADRCCFALDRINRYGKNTGPGSCGSISTTDPE